MSIGQAGGGAPSHPTDCEVCGRPLGSSGYMVVDYPKGVHETCLASWRRVEQAQAMGDEPTAPMTCHVGEVCRAGDRVTLGHQGKLVRWRPGDRDFGAAASDLTAGGQAFLRADGWVAL